jgi:hypothetical protein
LVAPFAIPQKGELENDSVARTIRVATATGSGEMDFGAIFIYAAGAGFSTKHFNSTSIPLTIFQADMVSQIDYCSHVPSLNLLH